MRSFKLNLAALSILCATAMVAVAQEALPPAYAQRSTEQSRLACIAKYGGTPEIEAAVTRSLEWLASQQQADGSWGAEGKHKCGFTGYAVQCFLAHGQAPDSAQYGDIVSKALKFLIKTAAGNREGMISEKPQSAAATYEHAIATAALGEACVYERAGATPIPGLIDAFVKAVKLIIAEQSQSGAWAYGGESIGYARNAARSDLSVSNWHFTALGIARSAGLRLSGLDDCIKKAVGYIELMQTKDGGFGNTNREAHYNQWGLTGGAVAGLQMLDPLKQKEAAKGIGFLREFLTQEPLDWNTNCDAYRLRYYTDAFFRAGGDDWKFYSAQLLPQVLASQQADGRFVVREKGMFTSAGYEVFNQAMYTLQLEVFYRLPH